MPPLTAAEAETLNGLDPLMRSLALRHREEAIREGVPWPGFLSGLRSRSQQAAEAERTNRTTPAAPPGKSKHEVGAAYDLNRAPADVENRLGAIAERLGLRWGGRFRPKPDGNHYEAPVTRAEFVAYRNMTLLSIAASAGLVLVVVAGEG